MIISHKHRFIFVHCRKAAGASLIASLSRHLGKDDLQFSAIADAAKLKIYPPRRVVIEALQTLDPLSYLNLITFRKSFWSLIAKGFKKKYSENLGGSTTHAPASAIAKTFPKEWGEYYKFCIVRNPWDKTVSDYCWRTKRVKNPPSFEEYIEALDRGESLGGIIPKNHRNWDMYTIDDNIEMDYVVRFEDMAEGLKEALSHTTLPWDGWMPSIHMNKNSSNKQAPRRRYQDYYSDRTAQVVARLYEKEIKAFGYTF
ncbi:MAG: sulfotransferase family 2 domain-containing protein [Gammaproteobacteria bacterium]